MSDKPVTIPGDLVVKGRIICHDLRSMSGSIHWGADDSDATQDLTLFLQPNCGSDGKQSALVLKPASKTNGSILILEPGDEAPPGTIQSEVILYGPNYAGNPRRQRLASTVFRQSDGNAFAQIDSTMSGEGDPQGLRSMPVLWAYDDTIAARLDGDGMRAVPKVLPDTSDGKATTS